MPSKRPLMNRAVNRRSGSLPGFTLTELLVVIAITAILMSILFIPLGRALDMSARAQATVAGQAAVQQAVRRVVKDLTGAVEVYEPRDIAIWGYAGAWGGTTSHPSPGAGVAATRYLVRNGLIAFRAPKQLYYDTLNDHFVTQDDVNKAFGAGNWVPYDQVAVGSCPRHPGAPVELRPVTPTQPDSMVMPPGSVPMVRPRITAYFLGLKNPGESRTDPSGLRQSNNDPPFYDNILLFRNPLKQNDNILNTYVLYRMEFDPTDPRYANWNLPSGAPNPDFFYDTTVAANNAPYWQNWQNACRAVMDSEVADAVQWLQTSPNQYVAHPLVTFAPLPVADEVAQPDRGGQPNHLGDAGPADLAPLAYQASKGSWTGIQADAWAAVWPAGNVAGPYPPFSALPDPLDISVNANGGLQLGPLIQTFDKTGALVFDSSNSNVRGREVSYDPLTGQVLTGFTRWDYGNADPVLRESYSGTVQAVSFTVPLGTDLAATPPTAMPSSFGAALNKYGANNTRVVLASDGVQLYNPQNGHLMALQRVGWTGLAPIGAQDPNNPVAATVLLPNQYSIDYQQGIVTLSAQGPPPGFETVDPNKTWDQQFGPNQNLEVIVKYRFQTNQTGDVVKVSYNSKSVQTVSVGIVEFTRRRQESLPFQVSERVAVRNAKR